MSNLPQWEDANKPAFKSRIERFFAQLPDTAELPKDLPGFRHSHGKVMGISWKTKKSGEQIKISLNIVIDELSRLIVGYNLRTADD